MIKKLLFTICLILLCSCISNIDQNGYLFNDDKIEKFEINNTKEKIINELGSPTLITNYDKETWIYIFEKTNRLLFFNPKVIERKILLFELDNNIVKKISKLDLKDGRRSFNFDNEITDININEDGIFEGLFGNIGKIRPM